MNQDIIKFLKSYSTNEERINTLIVSSFISYNNIHTKENDLIKQYTIDENSKYIKKYYEFIGILERLEIEFDFNFLLELFEFIISPKDKMINGAVYTPDYIREFIINKIGLNSPVEFDRARICDLSVGCGGFLLTIAKYLNTHYKKSFYDIYKNNLFGLDIAGYSIERCKILLTLLAVASGEDRKSFSFNLEIGNALSFDWKSQNFEIKKNHGFDIIVGNPPYVCSRNINSESFKLLNKWSVSSSGHPDLYIPFFQIGMENLAPGGVLGYITVNTFFKSINGRALRKYFSESKFDFNIIDFGGEQVFKLRNTYTCICFIRKVEHQSLYYVKTQSCNIENISDNDFNEIKYNELDDFNGWVLNERKKIEIINVLENTGVKLGSMYTMRTGIATLKNDIYKFKPIKSDKSFYYFLKDGITYQVEKKVCRNIINSNKLKSEDDLMLLSELIIFPYSLVSKRPILIKEREFRDNYPNAYRYLKKHKEELSLRDKGKKIYEAWYAYGRNQSLDILENKLFFPHISKRPAFVLSTNKTLLFYNGEAIISNDMDKLKVLKRVLESSFFDFYIKNTSKPYSSGYYSLSKNYIKNFSIPEFSDDEKKLILTSDRQAVDTLLSHKYGIAVPSI